MVWGSSAAESLTDLFRLHGVKTGSSQSPEESGSGLRVGGSYPCC